MTETQAILLRRQELRETSLIVIAMTREIGKVHGVVKGVRGGRAAVPWYIEPMTHQAVILYERKRSGLALMSSFDLIDAFDPIRRDFVRTAYATLCLDLVDAMTEIGDPHSEIFDLLLSVLQGLANGADPKAAARFLELHLLQLHGVFPDSDRWKLSPGARLSLEQMLELPWERVNRLRLSQPVQEEIRIQLQAVLHNVLEKELKSRTFLYQLGLERPLAQKAWEAVAHS